MVRSAADTTTVRFWGVRGGIPTPNAATRRYGGNTPCLEVRCGPHLIILDAGTGLRQFGATFDPAIPIDADIMISEHRFDHLCGLPFFGPGYQPNNSFKVWSGQIDDADGIEARLSALMTSPLFPIPLSYIAALKAYGDFQVGSSFAPRPGVQVRTAPLNNPGCATGYRLEYAGASLCYVNNTAHRPGHPDEHILGLIERADLVIYDSFYTDEDYPPAGDPGHSTWQEGVRLCRRAKAKRMIAFQHRPSHDDAFLDDVGDALDKALPGSQVAAEGLTISL
jgi:phosphoribosyl 1,2-cyclic phosphodiesterase